MALPSSGTITMAQVAAEIGISASGLSLNDSRVRQLAGKPSGAISFADLRGKSWLLPPTITLGSMSGFWGNANGYYYGSEFSPIRINFTLGGGPGTVTRTLKTISSGGWQVLSERLTSSSYDVTFRGTFNTNHLIRLTITVTNASGSASFSVNMNIQGEQSSG